MDLGQSQPIWPKSQLRTALIVIVATTTYIKPKNKQVNILILQVHLLQTKNPLNGFSYLMTIAL